MACERCPNSGPKPVARVDLLPGRETSSLAAWLSQRPGIEAVCRDRAPFFAEDPGPWCQRAISPAGVSRKPQASK